jgi:flagella basal body P-ring formation protein FlgA
MTARILILCCVAGNWALGQTPCVPVTGSRILGADLARVVPALKTLPPDLPIATSPLPGAIRTFPVSELQTLASRFAIRETVEEDICFRVATESLDRARVIESMMDALKADALKMDALKIPDIRIEVLDATNEPTPVGRIEFRRENLGTPAGPNRNLPIIWRGDVIYAGDRRFAIWAKVRITAPVTRLIAVESLRAGIPIKSGQIREEVTEAFPLSSGRMASLSQIEGLVPLRAIASGAEVRPDDVGQPYEVNRGDLVHVEVRSGAARLALTGRAESAGRVGDLVPVRNIDSSRVFPAVVEGKDSVVVLVRNTEESLK